IFTENPQAMRVVHVDPHTSVCSQTHNFIKRRRFSLMRVDPIADYELISIVRMSLQLPREGAIVVVREILDVGAALCGQGSSLTTDGVNIGVKKKGAARGREERQDI